jgi:hypothetical protein
MVVAAADPVSWTKPEDLPHDPGKPPPKLGGQFDDGFYAAFAEGSVGSSAERSPRDNPRPGEAPRRQGHDRR